MPGPGPGTPGAGPGSGSNPPPPPKEPPPPPKGRTLPRSPRWAPRPTGSFFGGGGLYAQGAQGQAVSITPGPSSFIGGGGQALATPNVYWLPENNNPGSGTFTGAGGQAIRSSDEEMYNTYWLPETPADKLTTSVIGAGGQLVNTGLPVFPVAPPLEPPVPSPGFGTNYAWGRRRGGGGGGYGGYGGYDGAQYAPNPYLNLFSWNSRE